MKKKITKAFLYIVIGVLLFFAGRESYGIVYRKAFKDGVQFVLNELVQYRDVTIVIPDNQMQRKDE